MNTASRPSLPLELAAHALARVPAAARSSTCAARRRSSATARDPRRDKRAPEAVAEWARELEPWRPVVVVLRARPRGRPRRRGARCARAASTRAIWTAGSKRGARTAARSSPYARADALGDARAAEDRPHRVPVARAPLHRSVGRVLLRFRTRKCARSPRRTARRRSTCRTCRTAHGGERCSFDAFIRLHGLADAALDRLAAIVRGADTGASTSRRRRRACSRRRTDCRRSSPTITRCCARA